MEQNEFHFLPGQDIGQSSFFLRFDEFKGFPVGVFEDVRVKEAESADGLFEEGFGGMLFILHRQQILSQFLFIDLFGGFVVVSLNLL